MEKNNNIIYGLVDPNTNEIRYVGKSTTGLVRPNRHKDPYCLRANTHKNHWIKSLLKNNQCYIIQVIETIEKPEDLDAREIYWINHYRTLGNKLTNDTNGGVGSLGRKLNERTKELIAQKRRDFVKKNGLPKGFEKRNTPRSAKIEINGISYKKCPDCQEIKQFSSFHKNRSTSDGIDGVCKPCTYKRRRARDDKKKLSPEAFQATYTARKEAMSEGAKRYYQENTEAKNKLKQQRSKPILRTNPMTGETKRYASALEAKSDGFNNTNLGQAIRSGKQYKGFYWKFTS